MEEDEDEDKNKNKSDALEGYLNNITSTAVTFDTEDGDQMRYEFTSNPRLTLNGNPVSYRDIYEYVVDRSLIYVELTLDDNGDVSAMTAEFCDVEGELTNVSDGKVYVKTTVGGGSKTTRIPMTSGCQIYLDGEKISESKAEKLFEGEKEGDLYAVVAVTDSTRPRRWKYSTIPIQTVNLFYKLVKDRDGIRIWP